jgi:hypothetical protein
VRLKHEDDKGKQMQKGMFGKDGLLSRARKLTEQEQGRPSTARTEPYAAAALGRAPYVAMGNGVIVVEKRCDWNC